MSSILSPSSRVVDAVARSKDVERTELPPLYETIDPDALDGIFPSRTDGGNADSNTVCVQFTYAGRDITVRSSDDIEIREPDSDQDHTSTT